jgi:hypothetical protein
MSNSEPMPSSIDAVRNTYLSKGLFATVFASWLVAPLGVIVLHFTGLGSDPLLVAILIALSVGAPFQILTNEFLAVGHAKGTHQTPVPLLLLLMILHAGASFTALSLTQNTQWHVAVVPDVLVIVSLITLNLLMSYYSVTYYTALLLKARVSQPQSWLNGGLPGVITLCLYSITAVTGWSIFLFAALVLPGLVHLVYFKILYVHHHWESEDFVKSAPPKPIVINILVAGILLSTTTYIGSVIRVHSIEIFPEYSGIILIFISIIGTIIFTVTRLFYLRSDDIRSNTVIMSTFLFFFLLTILLFYESSKIYLFTFLVAIQIITVLIVVSLRWLSERQGHSPTTSRP